MEYIVICLTALFVSGLTLFSGFGLGTVLTPVFAIFFPVQIAVAATAVVHLANNIFKLFLVGRSANAKIVVRFAFPAVITAIIGAYLLNYFSLLPVIAKYSIAGNLYEITAVKFAIGLIIIVFSLFELLPKFSNIAIGRKYIVLGGLLSGFFGGLSGNQGAFRSMFLVNAGLDKEEFIGTNVVSAVIVDIARLVVYGAALYTAKFSVIFDMRGLVIAAAISAFIGAFFGKQLMKKTTLRFVQILVGAMLILIGAGLSSGLI